MKKITFPDKTNDENAPESQRKFYATEANEIKNVVNHNATEVIDFTEEVALDRNYVSEHTVSDPINYIFSPEQSVIGSKRIDYLIADGINVPTFNSFFKIRYNGYLNEANRVNRVFLEYVGNNTILVDITYV